MLRQHGAAEALTSAGLPLGIQHGTEYVTLACRLEPGDTLLLTTDGLTEARRGGEMLGTEGLTRLAAEALGPGALPDVGAAIMARVKDYAGGSLRDDACLLLARRA